MRRHHATILAAEKVLLLSVRESRARYPPRAILGLDHAIEFAGICFKRLSACPRYEIGRPTYRSPGILTVAAASMARSSRRLFPC